MKSNSLYSRSICLNNNLHKHKTKTVPPARHRCSSGESCLVLLNIWFVYISHHLSQTLQLPLLIGSWLWGFDAALSSSVVHLSLVIWTSLICLSGWRRWCQTVGRMWKRSHQLPVSTNTQMHMCPVTCATLINLHTHSQFVPRRWRQRVPECREERLSEARPSGHSGHPLPALLPRHQVLLCAAALPAGQWVCQFTLKNSSRPTGDKNCVCVCVYVFL